MVKLRANFTRVIFVNFQFRTFRPVVLTNIVRTLKARRMRWADHVTRVGWKMNAYLVLVRKLEENRLLGRPGNMWKNNIENLS
jgi:hypothetical protein